MSYGLIGQIIYNIEIYDVLKIPVLWAYGS